MPILRVTIVLFSFLYTQHSTLAAMFVWSFAYSKVDKLVLIYQKKSMELFGKKFW